MTTENDWTTSDPSLYTPAPTQQDPNHVATLFLGGLLFDTEDVAELVTPQSRDGWGDFTSAREYMRSLHTPGLSTGHVRPPDARDVAYVAVLDHVGVGYVLPASSVVDAAAIVTLVWHDDAASWLVHSIGEATPHKALDRPSKGLAPERAS